MKQNLFVFNPSSCIYYNTLIVRHLIQFWKRCLFLINYFIVLLTISLRYTHKPLCPRIYGKPRAAGEPIRCLIASRDPKTRTMMVNA
jgi:hypothetical protein